MDNSDNTKLPIKRILFSMLLLIVAAFVWVTYLNQERIPTAAENARALIGGPFQLVNHTNTPVTDQDFMGKYMLVYFGYTFCPDVCPMDLQIMADALDMMEPDVLEDLNPVFVTVDPERDTVDVMAEYVSYFHKDMIGLTGTTTQINQVKKAYKVYAAKADDSPDYLVDHTAFIYLMDKNGKFAAKFNHGEDPAKMASVVNDLVSG